MPQSYLSRRSHLHASVSPKVTPLLQMERQFSPTSLLTCISRKEENQTVLPKYESQFCHLLTG